MKTSTSSLSFRRPFGSPSFALISVLALVSLAALTATAFLASARLERTATRPLGEKVRLEMALNIGFNCAKEIINNSMGSSYDTVATYWRTNPADDIGYLLSGYPRNLAGSTTPTPQMYWFAAFSTATMTELATNAPPTAVMTNRATVDNQSMFSNIISPFMATLTKFTNGSTNIELIGHTSANPRTSPPVGWMTIKQPVRTTPGKTNTVSTPVMRIAFFTEDLSGLIDVERMCGSTTRDTGTNPTEISMSNIGPTPGITFGTAINTRATYLSPFLLATNGGIATTNLRYFATGLRSWTNAVERVPRAIAIASGTCYGRAKGDPTDTNGAKFLIPTNPTASDLAKIAAALTTNLPDFGARGGAMSSGTYISNIAANIVDYVDTDANPTVSGATVGYDNYPLPVVFSDQIAYNWNAANPADSTITVTTYLQLWNCSTLTSPAVTYILQNNFQDRYLRGNGSNSPIRIFSNSITNRLSVSALDPNQIIVLTNTTTTNVGVNASYPGGLWITNELGINTNNPQGNADFTNLFELRLTNGIIISKHNGTYQRIGQKIKSGGYDFEGTCLTMSRNKTNKIAPIGDPRMLRFLSNPAANPLEYRSSSSGNLKWGGYANFSNHPANNNVWNGHPDNWPEGRKSTKAILTGKGQAGGNTGKIENAVAVGTPITLPGTAPAILSTNGKYLTIFELGNVFDPMQWKPPDSFTNNSKYAGCSIDTTWTNTGGELHGGGNTLRIGRPEHSRFAFTNLGGANGLPIPNMGQSAAALLDIFRTTTNGIDDGGRININTAPGPVLAALAGGITLSKDTNKVGSEDNSKMVAAFTMGVMKFRQAYPFYSPSQLPFISTNYGDANWTNTWHTNTVFSTNIGCGLKGITELNDQGMEEWFSKIYGLSTVQSRNFRIYVYAQMVNSNNVPYGRIMRKYYHLYTEQTAEGPNDVFNDAGYSMVPERESEY